MQAIQKLPSRFIKVCGVTREVDLQALASAGVHAVGFNFVPSSPRLLEFRRAEVLSRLAESLGIWRVGVLWNPAPAEVESLLEQVALDAIQLHGDEDPALQEACRGLPVIKAVTWSGRAAEEELVASWVASPQLIAFLLDAFVPGQLGGTGKIARWDLLAPRPKVFADLPLVLAGGLKPGNVREAILTTRCVGVDTASGVEQEPGVKDPLLISQFVHTAQQAWSDLPPTEE